MLAAGCQSSASANSHPIWNTGRHQGYTVANTFVITVMELDVTHHYRLQLFIYDVHTFIESDLAMVVLSMQQAAHVG